MPRRKLVEPELPDDEGEQPVVEVERRFIHPVMGKTVRRSKKYHAHDEDKAHKVGDLVRIRECRPVSKLKRWEVIDRSGEAEGKA